MKHWLIAGCAVILACGIAHAQENGTAVAKLSATNQGPLVGEPVQLTLIATFTSGATMVGWPDFPELWTNFEVREVGELNIAEQNGAVEYQQAITIALWEPGDYNTPETVIVYSDANGALAELFVPALTFSVPSVLTDDLTLRPLKPLVFLSYVPPVLIIGAVLVLVLPILWYAQRRSRPLQAATDWQVDIRELDRRMLALLSSIDRQTLEPGAVYAATADCLRDYLTQQYHIMAQELTTSELLMHMQPQIPQPLFNGLAQLMSQADLVKFARQIPNRESAQQYLETAARWIQAAASDVAKSNGRMGR